MKNTNTIFIIILIILSFLITFRSRNQKTIDYYANARQAFKDVCLDLKPLNNNPSILECNARIKDKAEQLSLACSQAVNSNPKVCENLLMLNTSYSERSINCRIDYYYRRLEIDNATERFRQQPEGTPPVISSWVQIMFNHLHYAQKFCNGETRGRFAQEVKDIDAEYKNEMEEYQKYLNKIKAVPSK